MKLQKIVSRLQELHPKEIDLSLDRIQNLCQRLGNPQDKLIAISIVGTNGKYSTIQAMFAILKETNIKCNIYSSPHVKSINERFIYNDKIIEDDELAHLLNEIEDDNIEAFKVISLSFKELNDVDNFSKYSQRWNNVILASSKNISDDDQKNSYLKSNIIN